jgi:hypothetical protein
LQQCFSPGVIELEPTEDGRKKAVVVNARSAFCLTVNVPVYLLLIGAGVRDVMIIDAGKSISRAIGRDGP